MRFSVIDRRRRDRLGEGPVWLPDRGELAWVDIMAPAVHLLDLETTTIRTMGVDEQIGWIIPRSGYASVIAGFRSGFHELDLETGARRLLHAPEIERPDNRLNDAKVDALGRIWAGSKDDTDRAASGALYRLDPDLTCTRLDDGYGVTNGPTFSPDGRTLYHTDSGTRVIYAFTLSEDGTLTDKRVWLRFEDDWGYPDGMTTDVEGCLWIAHWGGGAVSRFDPAAALIERVALPASNITSCAFAGPDLDRLFVTSSTLGREGEPLAGSLFELEPAIRGMPTCSFAG